MKKKNVNVSAINFHGFTYLSSLMISFKTFTIFLEFKPKKQKNWEYQPSLSL